MARVKIIEITCDICGTAVDAAAGQADRSFGVDGQLYRIDLCDAHMSELVAGLAPFTAAGRKGPDRPTRKAAPTRAARSASGRGGAKGIREWARANGFPNLSERGRVPSGVLAAWQATQGATSAPTVAASSGRARRAAKKAGPAKKRGGRSATAAARVNKA